jgi:hypothetical protein
MPDCIYPTSKINEEIEAGIKYALENGASGVSIFGNVSDEILAILSKYKQKPEKK